MTFDDLMTLTILISSFFSFVLGWVIGGFRYD